MITVAAPTYRLVAVMAVGLGALFKTPYCYAQTNSSGVTNTAAPNAISTTTGGSNLTYQSNNTYNNEHGFGPGIFCRTPALFISGNVTRGESDNYYAPTGNLPKSSNDNWNYGGNIGVVFPFGSSVQDYCKSIARQSALDKEVSTQLSMIRACAALIKEGVRVDPAKFPLLAPCVIKSDEPLLYIGTPGNPNPQASLPSVSFPKPLAAQTQQNNKVLLNSSPVKDLKIPRLSGN